MIRTLHKLARATKARTPRSQIQERNQARSQRRPGMTLIETTAAAVLLLIALGLVSKVISASNQAEQSAQQKALGIEILSSLLEEKMALPTVELTSQKAANWQPPFEAELLLPDAKLESEVTSVTEPVSGTQVTLKLSWRDGSGEQTAPVVLTAFAFPHEAEEKAP